ncbi:hypothetical protein MOK15_01185 [Sphingobium sp. BYY-5]|uniref:hypothetical protein n=1 Tax=Sphingobium sp. BYY-5 TaxID=2926400 RepID=UPI001FA705CD|nr:hypothetical protein [Sphingobium sp. BYY-5]MCI4588721.1 hypothetical protein [Sphingobium sp. BYY-5]
MTATRSGRPLRFFALLMIGWVAIRLAAQPSISDAPLSAIASPRPVGVSAAAPPSAPKIGASPTLFPHGARRMALTSHSLPTRLPLPVLLASPSTHRGAPRVYASQHHAIDTMNSIPSAIPRPLSVWLPAQPNPRRWRGSAWALWRPGDASRADIATAGRLGGSQAGLRIDYALAPGSRRHPAAYARLTSALERPTAPEAAIGVAIQPFPALPVSFAMERRIKLADGARNAMAVLAAGGFGPTRIAPGIDAEAYAQVGLVGFRRRDAFIDGKLSLLSPIAHTPLRVGAAISGGAQTGIERIDIGPEIQLRLPLPSTAARLSIEWRERIAGKAAPSSGLAVTLAADF